MKTARPSFGWRVRIRCPRCGNVLQECCCRAATDFVDLLDVKTFNPSSEHPARAVQAWQILVGKAMNRQIVTYELLSELMYRRHAAGVLAQILGHVAFYCQDNNLPPLTTLVVGKGPGKPSYGIPVDPAKIDEERESVYQFDWYDTYPPSEADFTAAYKRHQSRSGN